MSQPTSLIVCPTSHMDWNWLYSFEEYYKNAVFESVGEGYVQSILDAAVSLSQSNSPWAYNLAELAWLIRYLSDHGGQLDSAFTVRLSLLGGGLTSPDNIVCNGEVFVRTYLLGRQWARSIGLAIENVSWLPDDFGHDPELPVILSAMGLQAVGFSRVPGSWPNYNGPVNCSPSLACGLVSSGVAFYWLASDRSQVFAHFMPNTYGVPFWSGGATINANSWAAFVQSSFLTALGSYDGACSDLTSVNWPGGIAFAPAGGDFSVPDSGWVSGISQFNSLNIGCTATIGRFSDYVSAVLNSGAELATTSLDASNFWTGHFASRPALKTLQAHAARDLVAAEFLASLLWLASNTSSATLNALDSNITQIWNVLAPSSHHDFVTGTSPDRVYQMEQYPMLSLAAELARGVRQQALQTIANSIVPGTETVVVVYNAVGVERAGVFRLERGAGVSFGGAAATTQPLPDSTLLVQAPTVPSLGYIAGQLTAGAVPGAAAPVGVTGCVTLDNGIIAITLSGANLWGITSIVPAGGENVLPTSGVANLLTLYTDSGNLYQFGNEPDAGGTFSAETTGLTAGAATQTEFGPLRWSVEAAINGPNNILYKVVYSLMAGESLVRIAVIGSAPPGTTVATSFPAIGTDGTVQATHLIYGTPHHFHDDAGPAYWTGPTFKATHDFLMPAADTSPATFALAAIYHDGMPAWACQEGQIVGSLFRNTDGFQRGAAGTDSGTHTQRYALRISMTPLDASQGTPLVEALQFTNPLHVSIGAHSDVAESPITMPPTLSLASTPSPALVRVARPMGNVASGSGQPIQCQIAFRIYLPDANGTAEKVQLSIPALSATSDASASLVTALEDPIPNARPLTVNAAEIAVPAPYAVTTLTVTATRPVTQETNGE